MNATLISLLLEYLSGKMTTPSEQDSLFFGDQTGSEQPSLFSDPGSINLTEIIHILKQLTDSKQLTTGQLTEIYKQLGISPPDDHTASHHGPYERELARYTEYQVHKVLLLYLPPILIILGTFGNIFSFIILKRKAMLKFSTYFYLMVLAVADTLVLYIGLLQLWVGELTGFTLTSAADWVCKTTNVVGYTISDFSVWLIIAVTTERYIVVCHPLKANAMCNTPRARNVIIGLLAGFFLTNMHFFWTVEIREFSYDGHPVFQCHACRRHEVFVEKVWPWIDAFLYSFLPFIAIMVLNGLIIRQVILARWNRAALAELASGDYEQRRPSHEGSTRLTVMLLTISFAFLLTTLPMNIVSIAANFLQTPDMAMSTVARFQLARTITTMLMYCNHSMNFFLYCATGQKFRHQLVWMVCYAKRTYTWSWSEVSQNGTRLELFKNGVLSQGGKLSSKSQQSTINRGMDVSPLRHGSDCSDRIHFQEKQFHLNLI